MFLFSGCATAFAAKVHAIKEEITDALKRDLGEIDVYSDSRSVLEAFNGLLLRHSAVANIKDLIKHSVVKIYSNWIRVNVGSPGRELVDKLAKAAIELLLVDVVVRLNH